MNVPSNLRYTRSDEWVRLEGDIVTLGITDYAQHELGELVYVELPEVGQKLVTDVAFGVVESVKAVAELLAPVAGEVLESNPAVTEDPSIINNAAYEEGWLVRARITDPAQFDGLMTPEEYTSYRS